MKRKILPLLLLLCVLTGCAKKEKWVSGEIVERVRDANGALTAFVMETWEGKHIGFRMAEETWVIPYGESFGEEDFLFQEPDGIIVSVRCGKRAKALVADGGEKVRTYSTDYVNIKELLTPNAMTLSDGTPVGIWAGEWGENRYVLEDGTELLRERRPFGPGNVSNGMENVEDLPETARAAVLAYYEEQGELYGLTVELERAYAAWLALEDKETFRTWWVEQETMPTASNERLMYFQTAVTLPVNGNDGVVTTWEYSAAFDRETGAYIDARELFSCGEAEAKAAVLEAFGVDEYYPDQAEAMRANFEWEHLMFSDSDLCYYYPAGTLPGEEHGYQLHTEYDQLAGVLHDWAVPRSEE